jgi:uncharacterized protein (DUF362 family)
MIDTELTPPFARPVSRTAIRQVAGYDADLESVLSETLAEFKLPIQNKKILLKPNFVAPDPEGVIVTHPAVVMAAYESFQRLGASEVRIGDGAALERDAEAILESIRARHYLGRSLESFVDLNTDEIWRVPLRTRASALKELWLPRTILEADFIVSMPKLKTHHWAGVTLSGLAGSDLYNTPQFRDSGRHHRNGRERADTGDCQTMWGVGPGGRSGRCRRHVCADYGRRSRTSRPLGKGSPPAGAHS